jgi:hypothetical protein
LSVARVDGIALQRRHDGAAREHRDAVAHADDLGQLARNHHDGLALLCELAHEPVDLGLRAHVDTARGLVEDQHLAVVAEPARNHHLLLVSARQRGHAALDARRLHADALGQFAGRLLLRPLPHEPRTAMLAEVVHRDVEADREVGDQPLDLAALGQQADAVLQRLRRVVQAHGLAVAQNSLVVHAVGAHHAQREFGAARADQPRKAEDLALVHIEAVDRPALRELDLRHLEHLASARRGLRLRRKVVLDLAPDHHLDQRVHIGRAHVRMPRVGAVAQHADAVAHLEDLVQVMRDEDHRHAPGAQLAHDPEQVPGFVRREGGGRLVEHQQARLQRQRLADLDELLLRHGEPADRHTEVDLHAQLFEQRLRRTLHRRPVQQPETVLQVAAEKNVLHRVQVRDEAELLEDDADARCDRVAVARKLSFAALDEDAPLVGLVDAAQDLHQRRLARAVLAEQRVHLAPADREVDARERLHARKALGHAFQPEHFVVVFCRVHGRPSATS